MGLDGIRCLSVKSVMCMVKKRNDEQCNDSVSIFHFLMEARVTKNVEAPDLSRFYPLDLFNQYAANFALLSPLPVTRNKSYNLLSS